MRLLGRQRSGLMSDVVDGTLRARVTEDPDDKFGDQAPLSQG